MKHRIPFRAEATLFAFVLSFCAAACPVTAFPLNADLPRIALVLALFCGLCGFAFSLRHGILIPLGVMSLGAIWLWYRSDILNQTQSLLLALTRRYAMAYNTPVLCTWAENGAAGPVELPILVLGVLVAFTVSLVVARRISMVYVLIPLSLMPVSCIVVTDTVPHAGAIFGLFAGVLLLVLTDWSRQHRKDPHLTRMLALPVILAVSTLFLLNPEESYVNRFPDFQDQLLSFADQINSMGESVIEQLPGESGDGSAETLNLQTLGPRIQRDYPVMEVTSPVTGTLYLRGQDYDGYTGTGWTASRHRSEAFSAPGVELGQLTITTRSLRSIRYVPYYPKEEITLASGRLTNDGEKTYAYTLLEPVDPFQISQQIDDLLGGGYSPWSDPATWYLTDSTLEWAKPLAQSVTEGCADTEEAARAVGDYVRSSAEYNLDTRRMDGEYRDFAHWFLEESDSGYCVHFASAATVLLRSLNIPARYVEGYMVPARAGQTVTVSARQAHAWAEYYCNGRWQVLEATPADPEAEILPETVPPPESEDNIPTIPNREEETHPEETQPKPDMAGDAPSDEANARPFVLPDWIGWICGLILAVCAVWLQSELRLRCKQRRWTRGKANEKALNRYAALLAFSRRVGLPMPEELEGLAQKSRYSQHTLTREELENFDRFRTHCRKALAEKSLPRRLFLRLIWAED